MRLIQCVPLGQRTGSISIPFWVDGAPPFPRPWSGCELHCGSWRWLWSGSWRWLWSGHNDSPHNPSPENTGTKVQDTNKSLGSPSWLRNEIPNIFQKWLKIRQYSKYTEVFQKGYIPTDKDGFLTPLLLLVIHQPQATFGSLFPPSDGLLEGLDLIRRRTRGPESCNEGHVSVVHLSEDAEMHLHHAL